MLDAASVTVGLKVTLFRVNQGQQICYGCPTRTFARSPQSVQLLTQRAFPRLPVDRPRNLHELDFEL